MKTLILCLSLMLAACSGVAMTLSTCAYAQDQGAGSIGSPAGDNLNQVQSGGEAKPPADWFRPLSDDEMRFSVFFRELLAWEDQAREFEASGNSAEVASYRARLGRESGLTASEAAEVKRIAFQYIQDDQEDGQKMERIRNGAIAVYPNSWKTFLYSDPEYVALHRLRAKLLNYAIGQLVTALSPRQFARLDLYTRHYKDWMNDPQVRKQTESSEGDGRE